VRRNKRKYRANRKNYRERGREEMAHSTPTLPTREPRNDLQWTTSGKGPMPTEKHFNSSF